MNLDSMSLDEYLNYLRKDIFIPRGKYSLEVRLSIIRQLFKLFSLTENREQLTYIICNRHRIITEACAGAGKTVISLLKVVTHIMFEDIKSEETVFLTYTSKSSSDLSYKYESIQRVLRTIDLNGLVYPTQPKIQTLHSFFDDLIYEYAESYGVDVVNKRLKVLEDVERQAIMQDTVNALLNKNRIEVDLYDSLYSKLLSLYTQIKEKDILDIPEKWAMCSSYKEVSNIYIKDLKQIFEIYEKIKRGRRCIELGEYANFANNILQNDKIRHRWQEHYKAILVDEYQDVTQCQVEVLKLLINEEETPNNYLFAIGDGDQSIYGFRGAHSNGCLNFPIDYKCNLDDFARCFMTLNRRCPSNVLNSARKVIETLNTRVYKDLRSKNTGGYVGIVEVEDINDEVSKILGIIEPFSNEDLEDTVIAYRNNRSCRMIKKVLEEKGYKPITNSNVSDLFETTLEGCLNLLADPCNIGLMYKNLYKLVPKGRDFNSKTIRALIDAEQENRRQGKEVRPFYQLDYDVSIVPATMRDVLKGLRNISLCIRNQVSEQNEHLTYMDKIVPVLVYNYIRKYYLEWQDSKTEYEGSERIFDPKDNAILDPYSKKIYNYYCRNVKWRDIVNERTKQEELTKNSYKKINLCTFHSLKGLEFKNVILIDLRDNVFPGYELSEAVKFGPHFIKEADDEAKRLFYVAMTRSKENLWMLFNKDNPTRYLSYFTEDNNDLMIEDEFDFGLEDSDEVPWELEETKEFGNMQDLLDEEEHLIDQTRSNILSRWYDE